MTKQQIAQWLNAHSDEKRQYTYFTGDHYRITFANGDTYEHERKDINANDFIATISINGAVASKQIMREGWLPSGAWGVYEMKDITIAAA